MADAAREIPKQYDPSAVEDKWYAYWEEHNVFHSQPDHGKQPYTIVIPPPNITGMLTMGHILNNTLQDILIRMKRMQGYNACWVPGTDHASIATEAKVFHFLKEQGIDKFSIGREEFLKHCMEWKAKYGGIIIQQLRKLGVSCDWERERFTMDEHYYGKVIEAFVELYHQGLIYRGYRMVNWCPATKSAISDEEVIPRQTQGKLWYLKYPVTGTSQFITVATTRPETMLGDTGVAVNPADERYQAFIGKTVTLPITGREIPVFADAYVDAAFGTGAVKVTPAHDMNDYEMGQRHNLDIINIMNEDASLNHNVPEEFRGLDRYEARKKVIARLEEAGLLEKTDDYTNNVGYSERGGVPIEPYLSEQWFMKMDELAKPALDAVTEGKVAFHPGHWIKTYEHWMSGIRDWCISRQLWWGHRIPVWYCEAERCKEHIVATTAPTACPKCGGTLLRQDEDVLDTWASSWLWAHDVFKTEEEQKYYYPTATLVTGPDIIFFWVARMIMAGLRFRGDVPFRDVYFTSIIRDTKGRKMSKSLGNSPDPLDVIRDYGADALRFTVIYLAPLGQDVLFSTEKCELGRNFANKLWNAGRFLLMNAAAIPVRIPIAEIQPDLADRWILSRFNSTLQQFSEAMNRFEFNNAIKITYAYVWNDFCDWYIELLKDRFYSQDERVKAEAISMALFLFEEMLKIVHPFMPYITEELWQLLAERAPGQTISLSAFPQANTSVIDPAVEREMQLLQELITAVRNMRGELGIPPGKPLTVLVKGNPMEPRLESYFKKLTKTEQVSSSSSLTRPPKSASAVTASGEFYVPLEGLIDLDAEKKRLEKEMAKLLAGVTGVDKKLSNENFVKNAPPAVIEAERTKQAEWNSKLARLKEILENLS